MSWASAVLVAVVAVAVTFLPGMIVSAAAGARHLLLLVAAPALSVAMYATAALVYGQVGIPWTIASVAVFILVIAAAALVVRLAILHGRRARGHPRAQLTVSPVLGLSLAVAAATITVQLVLVYGNPDNVSQTYDAAFHLNGVRYILDTLNGSSLHLTGMILPDGHSSFYPAGWHDLISVVAMLTGGNVVAAANMTNLVVAAVVWPLGVLSLVQVLAPGRKSALVIAAFVSAAAPSFPLGMLDYGVLYPYFLALAFLPGAIALGLSIVRLVDADLLGPVFLQVLALVASIGSMAISQTSVVFGFGAIALVGLAASTLVLIRSAGSPAKKALWAGGFLGLFLVFVAAWWKFGSVGYTAPWQPYASPLQGLFEALTSSRNGTPPAILLTLLLIVGIVAELRRGRWWLPVMWAVPAVLFALSAVLPSGDLRNAALGIFYKDPPRLAALTVPLTVILATLGALALWTFVAQRLAVRQNKSKVAVSVAAIVGIVVLLVGLQGIAMQSAVERAAGKYRLSDSSQILSEDERVLLERIKTDVPDGAVIAGNPWTGTSWAYALSDRDVLNPHFNSSTAPDHLTVNRELNEANEDPAVCAAVKSTGVTYVLDFGVDQFGGRIRVDTSIGYEGLLDLDDTDVVQEVDRENDKVLYRITACGL